MADGTPDDRVIRMRYAGTCETCGSPIAVRAQALYHPDRKKVTCMNCANGSAKMDIAGPETQTRHHIDPDTEDASLAHKRGSAGASARREYERRSGRHQKREEERKSEDAQWREAVVEAHPILGRIATAVTPKPTFRPEPQDVKAWDVGSRGEETLGNRLGAWASAGNDTTFVLHDRRIPGTRANIDHIAISANGVWVIDAKQYKGLVEKRDVGGWLKEDIRLKVGGRDRTKLLDGLSWQVARLEDALYKATGEKALQVSGVLCFVGAEWGWFAKPMSFGPRTYVAWPSATIGLLGGEGYMAADEAASTAAILARIFPTA